MATKRGLSHTVVVFSQHAARPRAVKGFRTSQTTLAPSRTDRPRRRRPTCPAWPAVYRYGYLKREFPKLDYFKTCFVADSSEQQADPNDGEL